MLESNFNECRAELICHVDVGVVFKNHKERRSFNV